MIIKWFHFDNLTWNQDVITSYYLLYLRLIAYQNHKFWSFSFDVREICNFSCHDQEDFFENDLYFIFPDMSQKLDVKRISKQTIQGEDENHKNIQEKWIWRLSKLYSESFCSMSMSGNNFQPSLLWFLENLILLRIFAPLFQMLDFFILKKNCGKKKCRKAKI